MQPTDVADGIRVRHWWSGREGVVVKTELDGELLVLPDGSSEKVYWRVWEVDPA